ncbi:MAG: pyridoxal phosphate-dependent aminotransferase [Elusimicrobiota bacterium]
MLSRLAENIKLSPTLSISSKAKELKSQGKDVIGLGAGEPDFDTPTFIKKAAINALNKGDTKYTPASGKKELKQAVIKKFKQDNNLDYSTNQVIINCGAKHSLFNVIMCLADKGDEVIIPAPYWVSYPEMVKASGAEPVIVKCTKENNFKLTPKLIRENITEKTKLIIINSPSNPTGIVYTGDELAEIGKELLNHDIYIISDEIYEHLIYEGEFSSIAQISEKIKEKTIVVNGVSKAYSMTGWRIGYAAGDNNIISACAKLQSHSTSNPTSFSQAGAVEAITKQEGKTFINKMLKEFKKRRDFVYNELSSITGIQVNKPKGAFYIFPCIKEILNKEIDSSQKFASGLLENELTAVVPGEGFGAPGYIRISYATSMDNLKKGITRIKKFTQSIKPS